MPQFLEAMKKGATQQSERENYGRQGTLDYLKYGYVPSTYHESVNHTLDYVQRFLYFASCKTLNDSETATFYRQQALNYQQLLILKLALCKQRILKAISVLTF